MYEHCLHVSMLEIISMEHIITWINLFANRIKINYLTYKVFDQWNRHTTIPTFIVSNHEGFTSFCVKWDVLWNQKTEKNHLPLEDTSIVNDGMIKSFLNSPIVSRMNGVDSCFLAFIMCWSYWILFCSIVIHIQMGQVMKVRLSCYLVLLSTDNKTS